MKAGIFDPYLDTLGGGERYMMTIAEYLSEKGHEVNIFWDDASLKNKIRERLGIDLSRVNFIEDIFSLKKNLLKKFKNTRKYDLIFYLSDGSIPFLFAKKNILHFQVPFANVGGKRLINKIKFARICKVICNSKFTKKFIDKEFGIKSDVVYPPVDIDKFPPGRKENIILSVGRFTQTLHAKKQEVLLAAFEDLARKTKGWRLILAGGLAPEDKNYFKKLQAQAKNLAVEFYSNITFEKLKILYGKASIFWHAAGFGEDEKTHPERMEHFGIAVVEAMAAGCVPVVVGKGGIPEIIEHGTNGFLWQDKKELANLTLQLIAESQAVQPHSRLRSKVKSSKKLENISLQSIKASKKFSKQVFCQKINELIKG